MQLPIPKMNTPMNLDSVVVCSVCSDVVMIKYIDMQKCTDVGENMYLFRLTTCARCRVKILHSNSHPSDKIVTQSSTEIYSDDTIDSDSEMDVSDYEDELISMYMKVYEGFNTVVGTNMVMNMPIYRRLMSYMKGRLIVRSVSGFHVIEPLKRTLPDTTTTYAISSLVSTVSREVSRSSCGCPTESVIEKMFEVPYDSSTFFGDMIN